MNRQSQGLAQEVETAVAEAMGAQGGVTEALGGEVVAGAAREVQVALDAVEEVRARAVAAAECSVQEATAGCVEELVARVALAAARISPRSAALLCLLIESTVDAHRRRSV